MRYSTYQSVYTNRLVEVKGQQTLTNFRMQFYNRSHLMRVLVIVALLMLTGTIFMTAFASSLASESTISPEKIVVTTGDTLWNIALTHKPAAMDTRKYVALLLKTNHLSNSAINAGDIVVLPTLN